MARTKKTEISEEQKVLAEAFGQTAPISKDMIKAVKTAHMGKDEARFLVDMFYQMQDKRIAYANQIRSIEQGADKTPESTHEVLTWSYNNIYGMERSIFQVLDAATEMSATGKWLKSVMGIGPTLAAALLAYFDIERASSAGHFWSYAGLNDNHCPKIGKERAKAIVESAIEDNGGKLDMDALNIIAARTGRKIEMLSQKCWVLDSKKDIKKFKDGPHMSKENTTKAVSMLPYNANLKVICWKVGQQFAKLINNPKSLYGRILRERKAYEVAKNERGEYAEQAAGYLKGKKWDKGTDAYKCYSVGKLPPAQLQARAERYAVKLFISHLFECMYIETYHMDPPTHYVFVYEGHVDYIEPEVKFSEVMPWYTGKGGALK